MRFDLTDKEWAVIEPLLPPTRQGGERADDRKVLNGIFFVLRTGVPWDDLPERYGPHTTCYNRFNRWSQQGIWQTIFKEMHARFPAEFEMIAPPASMLTAPSASSKISGASPLDMISSGETSRPPSRSSPSDAGS